MSLLYYDDAPNTKTYSWTKKNKTVSDDVHNHMLVYPIFVSHQFKVPHDSKLLMCVAQWALVKVHTIAAAV